MTPEYIVGAELPDLPVTWKDSTGAVIDFSAGWTFEVKVGPAGTPSTTSYTKTTGITGAATAPNIVIAWATANEISALAPGVYTLQLRARRTSDSKDRITDIAVRVKAALP